MFRFPRHPATVTITDGVSLGFDCLKLSWRTWLPVVVAIAAVSFVGYVVIYSTGGIVDFSSLYYVDKYTDQVVWYPGAVDEFRSLIAIGALSGLAGLVGTWVFNATAISGLRNRPLTLGWVVTRGLWTIVSGIVIALIVTAAVVVVFIVLVIAAVISRPLGALLIIVTAFGSIPVAIYFVVRVVFTSLAVFDGFGPIEGIRESWRLSRGAVLRMFGWGLMAFLITLGFSLLASVVSAPFFSPSVAAVGRGLSTAIGTTASCFTVFMMAVLYESERARHDPMLYGPVPAPFYPAFGYPGPGYPGPGFPGPYPAGPYPAGPSPYGPGPGYSGPYPSTPGPYPSWPADPTAVPGWVNPNAPQAWPANPTAIPGWVNPNAPSPWPGYPPAYPTMAPGWGGPQPGPAAQPDQSQEPPSAGQQPPDSTPSS